MKATFVPVLPEGFEQAEDSRHITCLIVDESAKLEIYMWSDGAVEPYQIVGAHGDSDGYVRTVERLRSSPLWKEL